MDMLQLQYLTQTYLVEGYGTLRKTRVSVKTTIEQEEYDDQDAVTKTIYPTFESYCQMKYAYGIALLNDIKSQYNVMLTQVQNNLEILTQDQIDGYISSLNAEITRCDTKIATLQAKVT